MQENLIITLLCGNKNLIVVKILDMRFCDIL